MTDSRIAKLVGKHTSPDPFDVDGIELSPFVRSLIMDVRAVLGKKLVLQALKRITLEGVYPWNEFDQQAQVLQHHERYDQAASPSWVCRSTADFRPGSSKRGSTSSLCRTPMIDVFRDCIFVTARRAGIC